ncbi:hypothetical protein D7X48_18145 [bacterium D16-50]|nr:hypothetical protein D7X48_18145 [bacterium D16-50]
MIKDALQYLVGLAKPRTENINGKDYYFQNDCPKLVDSCHRCEAVEISTLTSLVDYIKGRMKDDFPEGLPQMIVIVRSETEVNLVSAFNDDMKRWEVIRAQARIPKIEFNKFLDQESFIIQMQAMFLDTSDKKIVMQVAGNVKDETVANYGDDGISQKATIKTGLANVEDVIVPNPVKLKPFRTFHEIGQPEIDFVFRMRNSGGGISCALFEADGGMWKFNTVHEIAEYLKTELKDVENVAVMS